MTLGYIHFGRNSGFSSLGSQVPDIGLYKIRSLRHTLDIYLEIIREISIYTMGCIFFFFFSYLLTQNGSRVDITKKEKKKYLRVLMEGISGGYFTWM